VASTEIREQFLTDLSRGIIESAGSLVFDEAKARALAEKVLAALYEIGPFAYPSLLDEEELRFVYQWDENPPLVHVMWWNERMWQDMARVPVPLEIDADINQ
jgi:hypothetical protein